MRRTLRNSLQRFTFILFGIASLSSFGCRAKPSLRAEDIVTVTYQANGETWNATPVEIDSLVAAYNAAKLRRDDAGTTPAASIDVRLKSGNVLRLWGGSEGIQGVVYHESSIDLRGSELDEFFAKILRHAESRTRSP